MHSIRRFSPPETSIMRASRRFVAWVTLLWMAGSGCASSRGATPSPPLAAVPPAATPAPTAVVPPTVTPAPTATSAPSSPPTPPPLPRDIRWVRTSAEYRALATQVYRAAAGRLPALSKGLAPGSWGVILDADETVFDNSEYQRRRAEVDSSYTR